MLKYVLWATVAAAAFVTPVAQATLTTFTDRTTWETAAGGAPSYTLDFDSYGADVLLSTSPDVGPFSISSTGGASRIDVSPFLFGFSANGTPGVFIQLDVVDPESVTFTFDNPTRSWGADVRTLFDGGDTFNVSANNGMMTTLTLPGTSTTAFRGFTSTTTFTSITFSTTIALSVDNFTDMFVDNVSAHAVVPEASAFLCCGLSAVLAGGCCWLRRKWPVP